MIPSVFLRRLTLRSAGSRRGFTLIEIVLYVAITSLLVVPAVSLVIRTLGTRARTDNSITVQQNLRYALQRIEIITHNANNVIAAGDGILTVSSGATMVQLTLANGRIYLNDGPTNPLTSQALQVTQMKFTNMTAPTGGKIIKVELQATGTSVVGSTDTASLQTSISLRR